MTKLSSKNNQFLQPYKVPSNCSLLADALYLNQVCCVHFNLANFVYSVQFSMVVYQAGNSTSLTFSESQIGKMVLKRMFQGFLAPRLLDRQVFEMPFIFMEVSVRAV